jgi:hypothetical protein
MLAFENDEDGDVEIIEESDEEGTAAGAAAAAALEGVGSDGEGSTVTNASSVAVGDRLEATRLLTERELRKLQRMRERRAAGKLPGSKAQAAYSTVPSAADGRIAASDLSGFEKKRRQAIEERTRVQMAGRAKKDKGVIGGGSTNMEKKRKKNFTMIKHSRKVRAKFTMSLKQKERSIGKKLAAMAKDGKKTRSGRR